MKNLKKGQKVKYVRIFHRNRTGGRNNSIEIVGVFKFDLET